MKTILANSPLIINKYVIVNKNKCLKKAYKLTVFIMHKFNKNNYKN